MWPKMEANKADEGLKSTLLNDKYYILLCELIGLENLNWKKVHLLEKNRFSPTNYCIS